MKNKKLIFVSLIFFLLQGCASAYKPTSNVLALSRNMSKTEAMNIVTKALNGTKDKSGIYKTGICGGAGIPSGDSIYKKWDVNNKDTDTTVSKTGFSINAFRNLPKTTLSGYTSAPIASTRYSLSQPFRQSVNFADIEYVRIFNATGLEYQVCYIHDGHSGVMMGLTTGFGNFYGITIEEGDLEKFIAAMMILAPKAEVQNG